MLSSYQLCRKSFFSGPTLKRGFHHSLLLQGGKITRKRVEEVDDIRNLLDEYHQGSQTAEQRVTSLSSLISQIRNWVPSSAQIDKDFTQKEKYLLKLAHVYKGKALLEMEKKEEALEEMERGEELSPDNILYFEKARILTLLNKFSLAVRYLGKTINEVIPGDPLYVEALMVRAQCYHQMGDKKKALQDVNEAIFYQPENHRCRLEKGRYLEDNPDEAIEEYEKVLDAENVDKDSQAEAYFRIGYAYLKKGEPEVAIRSLQQSERVDPEHPRVQVLKEILKELETRAKEQEAEEKRKAEGGEGGEGEAQPTKRGRKKKEEAPVDPNAPVVEKPKRTRKPKVEGEAGAAGEGGEAEAKPKRTRKPKVQPEGEGEAKEGEAAEAKPKRTRKPKEATEAPATSTEGQAQPAEAKPKRTRKPKETTEAPAQTTPIEGQTETPKPKRTRKTKELEPEL
eukprot:TRINITY_DN447_c0_g1_i1.p1 TRINITY_DN447_c0_g1~~TRINITY_DN447_c0_g1_i1.p1  ORF type:complete len:453 (+),score=143.53 TRINITY_DN447_c0_g1_i1:48-1406(+)